MDAHLRAIAHLELGDWQAAHPIVQDLEDPIAYWLHAVVHRLEGDLDNARYWYRRARRDFEPGTKVSDELVNVRAVMAGERQR